MKIFNTWRKAACMAALCMATTATYAQTDVTCVDRPTLGTSVNYPGYRAPLHGGYLLKLPVGKVQPKGWLLEYMKRQAKGLNGELGTLSAWLDKNNNQWLSDGGDHGWEEVPYWLRGYASMAYILSADPNNPDLTDEEKALYQSQKDEAQVWFEGVFANLKSDGFLGPQNTSGGKPEVWAQMIMLWALQTYYEYSGDQRALDAMTNYFAWENKLADDQFLEDYWEHQRGSDNEWSAIWLFNRTGNTDALTLIEKLHQNTADWMQDGTLPNWHGVNVAQGFREPGTYYVLTGNEDHLKYAYANQKEMRRRYGQVPGGMYGADENARSGYGDPRQGAETCALVEQMASDEILMGITGDPYWADNCEDVALNTFTAALTTDMRALRYITSPNMAISDGVNHGGEIDNALRGMLSMNPFSSRCCQHNHGMGWPYYTEHLVMATADNGLATMLYAASETTAKVADQQEVKLIEETNYPFEEQVRLTLQTNGSVTFPLYLRVPAWSKETSVTVNGEAVSVTAEAGKYIRIEREWQSGDQVVLNMPMSLKSRVWERNKSSVSFDYGPLTLSLKIDEYYKQRAGDDPEIVQDDSHWQDGVNRDLWPAYEIYANSDWNYAIDLDNEDMAKGITMTRKAWPADNFPFSPESVPLEFKATGHKIPSWTIDMENKKMTPVLPTTFVARDAAAETITLVPMGATRLRIASFPRNTEKSTVDPDCEEE